MPISYLRRTAAVAAVAAGSLTFLGAPAGAQTDDCYPPTPGCVTTTSTVPTTGPTLRLSDTTVTRGQTITATVSGFRVGSTGIITIASVEQQIGSFTVGANGTASTSVRIPTNISLGGHTVFARGTLPDGRPGSASQAVTVVVGGTSGAGGGTSGGGGGGGGGTLARTGAVVIPTALVGVGLVVGGVALKRSSRRGKTSTSA